MKEVLAKLIHERKPNLKPSSITTYTSILSKLFKELAGDIPFDIEFYTKSKKEILNYIAKLENLQTQKTILSALYNMAEK